MNGGEFGPWADHHVHSEWSWDAPLGDMERTCARAVELGLPSIAFTEHADWARGAEAVVDMAGYLEGIERCRAAYPGLRILSGVELGEPHQHEAAARELLAVAPLERVLGSVHYITYEGVSNDASHAGFLDPAVVDEMFRAYLRDVEAMIESSIPFEVLAHLDYPKRYWPEAPAFDDRRSEGEIRSVLRAAAKRGTVLEVNSTRAQTPVERYLCPSPTVVRWWREEGGRAVSLGSDAHAPEALAAGLAQAAQAAEAAGFRPPRDRVGFWGVG